VSPESIVLCDYCGKDITKSNYGHFDGQGHGPRGTEPGDGKCPLYDPSQSRKDEQIEKAGKEAMEKVRKENPVLTEDDLKIKFASDVEYTKKHHTGDPVQYFHERMGFPAGLHPAPAYQPFARGPGDMAEGLFAQGPNLARRPRPGNVGFHAQQQQHQEHLALHQQQLQERMQRLQQRIAADRQGRAQVTQQRGQERLIRMQRAQAAHMEQFNHLRDEQQRHFDRRGAIEYEDRRAANAAHGYQAAPRLGLPEFGQPLDAGLPGLNVPAPAIGINVRQQQVIQQERGAAVPLDPVMHAGLPNAEQNDAARQRRNATAGLNLPKPWEEPFFFDGHPWEEVAPGAGGPGDLIW